MQLSLTAAARLDQVELAEANRLLEDWQHPLGPCRRPFGSHAHVLTVADQPVAVTISASTVSATIRHKTTGETIARDQLVELARIARAPDQPWAMRPMIRLWREVCGPAWPYWTPTAAASYAMPGTPGDIYRFDGWENWGHTKPSTGGGTWSNQPAVNDHADGRKTLWVWRYQ